jgi:3-deoxy-D-manno-octulosonic-acid transferase
MACGLVENAAELGAAVTALLRDPQLRRQRGAQARLAYDRSGGALDRLRALLAPLLEEPPPR